jgi:plastocyanin
MARIEELRNGLNATVTRRQFLTRSLALGVGGVGMLAALSACGSSSKATSTVAAVLAPTATSSTGGTTVSPTSMPSGSAVTSPSAGAGHTVQMTDALKFDPATLTVSVGDTVTWENTSSMAHTTTCDKTKASNPSDVIQPDGGDTWDSGLLNAGQSYSHTFKVAGDYQYVCLPHEVAGMIGKVTVSM